MINNVNNVLSHLHRKYFIAVRFATLIMET